MTKPLSSKEEAFCQDVVGTYTLAEAYRRNYASKNHNNLNVNFAAKKIRDKPHVAERIAFLQKQLQEKNLWTREMSVKVLGKVAISGARDNDKIKAVCELNKMHGFYAPTRIDHTNSDGTLVQKTFDFTALSNTALGEFLDAAAKQQ